MDSVAIKTSKKELKTVQKMEIGQITQGDVNQIVALCDKIGVETERAA